MLLLYGTPSTQPPTHWEQDRIDAARRDPLKVAFMRALKQFRGTEPGSTSETLREQFSRMPHPGDTRAIAGVLSSEGLSPTLLSSDTRLFAAVTGPSEIECTRCQKREVVTVICGDPLCRTCAAIALEDPRVDEPELERERR